MSKMKQPTLLPCNLKIEEDRLSHLPGHIIDEILSHLSLREAIQTSILSKNWRSKWTTLPCLVFDNQSILVSAQDQTLVKNKLVNVVDHVLSHHSGLIHKFELSHRYLQGWSDIDRWILLLSSRFLEEFVLEIWIGNHYELPSAIYFCENLTRLELFGCLLKPPNNFNRFKNVKNLDLQRITMEQLEFENMIGNCPLLERLTLMNFDGFSLLNIHAPNLLFLDVGGVFEDVIFLNTPHLAVVSIGLFLNTGSKGNLINFFAYLPHIQRLEIQNFFLKYLAAGPIPANLPTPCLDLSFLSIQINFNDIEENQAALCLLRSSPNLQELQMLARVVELQSPTRTLENFQSFQFNQLGIIKIVGISGLPQELNFIKFMLTNTPVLERMTIKPCTMFRTAMKLAKELLLFRRASMAAKIILED